MHLPDPLPHLVIIGSGNPARQDDAAAPILLEALRESLGHRSDHYRLRYIETLQLNPENAYDLLGADKVIFIDCGLIDAPVLFKPIMPEASWQLTTHQQTPEAILAMTSMLSDEPLPACFLLAIQGNAFELGEPLTSDCINHLDLAKTLVTHLANMPDTASWHKIWHQEHGERCARSIIG
ncbi:Uncharacterised protein [BD1-7 clade bacterium]|uniref:Hydrogenase maturation protease n=1 Tax=BD1-7 clade bacterium TaxID=2029982 RepID=A0A5S9QRZ8_9GAMM|nr:Uncharacterised protein [BD1-7 clade bacterium]CAA0121055.1 Uncharacterised protein [BD1-7 clade bacterium]